MVTPACHGDTAITLLCKISTQFEAVREPPARPKVLASLSATGYIHIVPPTVAFRPDAQGFASPLFSPTAGRSVLAKGETMLKPWAAPAALCLVCVSTLPFAAAENFQPRPFDWPQWQGPQRDGISQETGLLPSWPKEGPHLVWKATSLGGGYSTPSIAAGRVFGMGYRKNEGADDEVVWALQERTGKELWHTTIGPANHRVGYGEGPRCTPTVDGERLYALGVSGDLVCLEVATGKQLWRHNLVKEFDGRIPGWGYSESPLVDGSKVIVTPGKRKATLVAFDKMNGQTIWTSQVPEGDNAQYASAIVADLPGQRQYVQFLSGGVVAVAADDGAFLWRYDHPANGTANISTPIFHDGAVFAASAYGKGGGLVKLMRDGPITRASEVYFTQKMENHHGGMVVVDGYLYGANGGQLACLEVATGKVQWQSRTPGKGSILYADGRLYYRNEGGNVCLIEVNPHKYVEQGRFMQPDRSNSNAWAHPVIANGRLYLADQNVLLCYDVKKQQR
jgi:outer membrane protein assembly factor BamB